MLGKRGRPPFRRTTSMSEINASTGEIPPPLKPQNPMMPTAFYISGGSGDSAAVETADFLKTCGLCNRHLPPGRDIYMYRGDAAFCSLECREQQIKQDEEKERRAVAVSRKAKSHHNHSKGAAATASETSRKSKTVAAT